jgi:hypothetical protein
MNRKTRVVGTKKSPQLLSRRDEDRYRADAASYIAELSKSLAAMARNHRLDTLAFILEMAQLEAEDAAGQGRE